MHIKSDESYNVLAEMLANENSYSDILTIMILVTELHTHSVDKLSVKISKLRKALASEHVFTHKLALQKTVPPRMNNIKQKIHTMYET